MSQRQPKTPKKNDDDEELHSDQFQDVPDWQQEFRHGLVHESVPEHRDASSCSHELPMDARAKVVSGSGKHSVFTRLPKDRNWDICLRAKNYKGFFAEDVLVQSCPERKILVS